MKDSKRNREGLSVVLITGIYPPDIGGPATHIADLRVELLRKGHRPIVVTLTDDSEILREPGIIRFPRRWPWQKRLLAIGHWLVRHRDRYDVVYASGLHPAAVVGGKIAKRPVVVKVVGDSAWERSRRLGMVSDSFDRFQHRKTTKPSVMAMRWVQTEAVRQADLITTPSRFLAGVVEHWLSGPADISIVPNGVRLPSKLESESRSRSDGGSLRAVFLGRLVTHKRVDTLLDAVAATPGVSLEIIGDGPSRRRMQSKAVELGIQNQVSFVGSLPHRESISRLAKADVLLLASEYEGLPHVAIEALAVGTPIIGSPIRGLDEVLVHGSTGLAVDSPTPKGFADALNRLRTDPRLLEALQSNAREASRAWQFDATVEKIEDLLRRALNPKPLAIFFGKGGPKRPLTPDLERKYRILLHHLRAGTVCVGRPTFQRAGRAWFIRFPDLHPRLLGGAVFYSAGALVAMALAVACKGAIVCQSPYEGAGIAALRRLFPPSLRPHLVVEVHGDWRTASRLYGSRWRAILAPFTDAIAVWALQQADRVRVVSNFTEKLVRNIGYLGVIDHFVAFSDFSLFLNEPPKLSSRQSKVLVAAMLEPYKGIDILLEAWSEVHKVHPNAVLEIAGEGSHRIALERQARNLGLDSHVRFLGGKRRSEIRDLMDESLFVVLPSRSEGLGLVVLEAMARRRPVVAASVGGIPELVQDGVNGRLVPAEDVIGLANVITELLEDARSRERMGEAGYQLVVTRDPETEFAAGIERLAKWLLLPSRI